MNRITLKPGREKSLIRRHPWVFSGAVAEVEGEPERGETVEVADSRGRPLALGAWSPCSSIVVRVWTFDREEEIGGHFFRRRIDEALGLRKKIAGDPGLTGWRIVHAESDRLPGLVVDRYGDYLVCQFTSAGSKRWREKIVDALMERTGAKGIYERSDVAAREKEGLPSRTGLIAGEEPPALVEIREDPFRFLVDLRRGQKTGFYLDQRENRRVVALYAEGGDVLNCFAYTGGFTVAAFKGGARRVTSVDSSADALDMLLKNLEWNEIDRSFAENLDEDVFGLLRRFRGEERRFDLVILDPPRFVDSREHLPKAARGYKDINLLAFQLLRPGGHLVTFSCSGLLEPGLFQKIVADAALDARREASILRRLGPGIDHPIALAFPQGSYLKGLVCRVL